MPFPPPSPVYLGPAKFHGDADNKPISRIVMHCTVSPCVEGQARNTAAYFRDTVTRPSSAHYVVDPGEVVQVVYDSVVAYHAPPNKRSIGVELCDPLKSAVWDQKNAGRWGDADHQRMLRRASRLVARLCLAYDVPAVRVTSDALRRGSHGITGHFDVSQAFGQSSHWDPGTEFPWDDFIARVQRHVKRYTAAQS